MRIVRTALQLPTGSEVNMYHPVFPIHRRFTLNGLGAIGLVAGVLLFVVYYLPAYRPKELQDISTSGSIGQSNRFDSKPDRNAYSGKSTSASTLNRRYVTPRGSNSAKCTNNTTDACTFARADALAKPGWTIHVSAGTYASPVYLESSGTAGNPVTWLSDTRWGARIIVTSSSDSCFYATGSYVTVEGFEISENASNGTCRIGLRLDGAHVVARHNYIHDLNRHDAIVHCGRPEVFKPNNNNVGAAGILVTSQPSRGGNEYAVVDSNIVDNIGGFQPHHGEHDCPYVANFYLSMSHMIATNNLSLRAEGYSFSTGGHLPAQPVYDQLLISNTAIADGYGAFYLDCDIVGCTDYALNNIVDERWSPGIIGFSTALTGGTAVLSNNLINMPQGGRPYTLCGGCTVSNPYRGDPLFVNYTGNADGDYGLQPGSPAINKGLVWKLPSNDFGDTIRKQEGSHDLGAQFPLLHADTAVRSKNN